LVVAHSKIGHLDWGKRAEAQQVLVELTSKSELSYVSAYDIGVIYAGLGESEQAINWLDEAFGRSS